MTAHRDIKPDNGPLFSAIAKHCEPAKVLASPEKAKLNAAIASAIEQRAEEWWNANPHLIRRIVELALEAKRAGVERYGMKALFEVLRWDRRVRSRCDGFKLNNNFTAYVARRLMAEVDELDGFFETRGDG